MDRLGEIAGWDSSSLSSTNNNCTATNKELANGGKRKLLDTYNQMTLKELKNILRQYGTTVSGNKRELVHRLMNLQTTLSQHNNSQYETLEENEQWTILDPIISFVQGDYYSNAKSDASESQINMREDEIELPFLSGLMFVNKPAGYSTLPTKQQLDNPLQPPQYQCLSDCVKSWLYNHPQGQERLKKALKDEERWWDFILQSLMNDPIRRKKLKKRKTKLRTKLETTFEPRPVHRLDIDTSGIVCIALTPTALRAANMLFERKSRVDIDNLDSCGESKAVQKRYVALVNGEMGNERGVHASGVVKHAIGKVWVDDHNEWACDTSDDGTIAFIRQGQEDASFVPDTLREAVTSYQAVNWTSTISNNNDKMDITRVELTPHTGRGHQLRLHMASIGHPILGDDMHGAMDVDIETSSINGGRLCLHASKLSMNTWSLNDTGDGFQICRVTVESSPPF